MSRAIAKDPAQRYQTGAEMAADIQKLRATRKLLTETAGSLAVVSQESAVPTASAFQTSPAVASTKTRARVGLGALTTPSSVPPASLHPTKIALAVAALMIVATAVGLHFRTHSNSGQSASANGAVASVGSLKSEVSGALDALSQARPQPARLEIEIEHHFVIARASVWLDDNLVYQKELQGNTKKHALVLQRTRGFDAGTVKLPAGPHTVKVRVQSGIDSYDLSKTVSGTLVSGRQARFV